MKPLMMLAFCLFVFVNAFSQQTEVDSIYVDTFWRKFIIFTPQTYYTDSNKIFPVIINMHGYTSDALQQMLYTNMNAFADTAGFIVVYPYGTKDTLGYRYWNAGFSSIGANDVFFLDSLIKHLIATKRIDPEGVFFCGLSNGGIMSYYMACFSESKIRGIGSVAGSPLTSWFPCLAKPVPVIHFHGTADSTVPYNGGYIPQLQDSFITVRKLINFWKETNYCVNEPDSLFIDRDLTDGTQVVHYKWKHKTGNYYPLELFKVINGGHTWPGATFTYDVTTRDIHASAEIIRFFKYIYTKNVYVTGIFYPQKDQATYQLVQRLHTNTYIAFSSVDIYNIDGKFLTSVTKGQIFTLPKGVFVISPEEIETKPSILIAY